MTELVCIVCPRGCHLKVDAEKGYKVSGHGCPRGEEYGRAELLNPTRIVTSTVRISGAMHRRCPVKTDGAMPKKLVLPAVRLLESVELKAPVRTGQVVLEDACGTGVRFVVTRDMQKL